MPQTDIQLSGNAEKALRVLPEVLREQVYGEALGKGASVLADSITAAFKARFTSRSGGTAASAVVIPADEVYESVALVQIGEGRGVAYWLSEGTAERFQPTPGGGQRYVGKLSPDPWIRIGRAKGRKPALAAFIKEYDRRLTEAARKVRKVK